MKITCGGTHPPFGWPLCTKPAVASIEVWWKDPRPGQGDGRIDYPHCALHQPDAERMAYMLQEHLESSPDFFDVRIERFIEGVVVREGARLLT